MQVRSFARAIFPGSPRFPKFTLGCAVRAPGTAARGCFDYPRAPLQRALLLLLLQPAAAPAVALLLALPPDASPDEIHTAYRGWWSFYN